MHLCISEKTAIYAKRKRTKQLDIDASEEEQFRNSEWSSSTNEAMIKDIYHFKTPYGKLGELIDKTFKEKISKVFLEDMLYETWNYARTVIIGDGKAGNTIALFRIKRQT